MLKGKTYGVEQSIFAIYFRAIIGSRRNYKPGNDGGIYHRYQGKIVGGIYDDRFLVKPTKSAIPHMPAASREVPYDGAKEMLLAEETDDKGFLAELFRSMYDELPTPKGKKNKLG